MDASNLLKWESNMTAMERRILVTHLVARAQEYMLEDDQDSARIGCFEQTGSLITASISNEKDKLISPQGVTVPFIVPVLPPSDQDIEEERDPEPANDSQEVLNMAQIFGDIDLEELELILEDDIENDITQEASI